MMPARISNFCRIKNAHFELFTKHIFLPDIDGTRMKMKHEER